MRAIRKGQLSDIGTLSQIPAVQCHPLAAYITESEVPTRLDLNFATEPIRERARAAFHLVLPAPEQERPLGRHPALPVGVILGHTARALVFLPH